MFCTGLVTARIALQEREKKAETWAPRWYRKPADKTVLPNEYSEEEVPMWEFTGEGFSQPKQPASSDGVLLSPMEMAQSADSAAQALKPDLCLLHAMHGGQSRWPCQVTHLLRPVCKPHR